MAGTLLSAICYLCTRMRKGNVQLKLPAFGARVGKDESFLLDCTRASKWSMSSNR